MHRCTASFLLLVMFAPAFGPLALAGTVPSGQAHCMRRPLRSTPAAEPAVHCHHGAPHGTATALSTERQRTEIAASPASSEASLSSLGCCPNHGCCRSQKTSEWARPTYAKLSFVRFKAESAHLMPAPTRFAALLAGPDSARAPPIR